VAPVSGGGRGEQFLYILALDTYVACGAAVVAYSLEQKKVSYQTIMSAKKIVPLVISNVTPSSLGVGVKIEDDPRLDMSVIIPKNSPYPITVARNYFTVVENQEQMFIRVYVGEQSKVDKNVLVDTLLVTGLPGGEEGEVCVEVRFALDEMGIFRATVDTPNDQVSTKKIDLSFQNRLVANDNPNYEAYPEKLRIKFDELTRKVYLLRHNIRAKKITLPLSELVPFEEFIHNFHGPSLTEKQIDEHTKRLLSIKDGVN